LNLHGLKYLHFKFHKSPLANNRDISLESLSRDSLYILRLGLLFFCRAAFSIFTISYSNVLSRAINFGRQCHFKIWLDCHKLKNFPCLIMPMSTKCQTNEKKMTINVIQHDDRLLYVCIYDCFTMEDCRLRQRMTLTTKIYCSRLYLKNNYFGIFSTGRKN
jgi:hypothetical protein